MHLTTENPNTYSKYLHNRREKIHINTIIVEVENQNIVEMGNQNIPVSIMDRSTRQKIKKEIKDLNKYYRITEVNRYIQDTLLNNS